MIKLTNVFAIANVIFSLRVLHDDLLNSKYEVTINRKDPYYFVTTEMFDDSQERDPGIHVEVHLGISIVLRALCSCPSPPSRTSFLRVFDESHISYRRSSVARVRQKNSEREKLTHFRILEIVTVQMTEL